jgi:hypothetical protein
VFSVEGEVSGILLQLPRRIQMKKLLVIGAALLLVAPTAWSQTCFDFDPYCDGLELTLTGGAISGYWRNVDCAGTDVPVTGVVRGGNGLVLCDYPTNPCPANHDWGFIIDGLPLDGTMVMYSNTGTGWTLWLDPLNYSYYSGPCLFAPGWKTNAEASWMFLEQNEF